MSQTIDDSIVMSLEVLERDLVLVWAQLVDDYNTVTPAQRSVSRKELLNFVIIEDETLLLIKQKYKELFRKLFGGGRSCFVWCCLQGGVVSGRI